jgi:hypothetical protein
LSWGSSGLNESLLFDGRKFLIGDSFSGEIDISTVVIEVILTEVTRKE